MTTDNARKAGARIIAVAGATGNQGGAVARHLLARGERVRALTRNPASAAARALAQAGAEVVAADFDQAASLEQAVTGAYGVFSVQNMRGIGTEREAAQGIALADAARRAGVQHFVYTSVGGAERKTGIGHFESKWQVEEHVRAIGLPATILRPVFFTDNLLAPGMFGFVVWSAVAGALRDDRTLQMISVEDIGAIAAIVFAAPERFLGQALEIAGDEVSLERALSAFQAVTGKRPRFVRLPVGVLRLMDRDLADMFRWFRTHGYAADIDAVRAIHPGLQGVDAGLRASRVGQAT
jgi:uncharacterized protein YbjT (DUF2867 family)